MHKNVNNLINLENQLKHSDCEFNDHNTKIIAVSKTFPIEDIKPLIDYGHQHFGENKIQEAIEKWPILKKDHPNLKLHMLGKLQTNKVKFLLPLFDYIHSLDSEKLAKKIYFEEKKKNKKIKIFIQVNIGNEIQKNGIDIKDVGNFYSMCTKELNLNIIGLMCIPPKSNNSKKFFMLLKNIAIKFNLKELSMGMSADYLEAIKCGSTYIRVGSNIFGTRTY